MINHSVFLFVYTYSGGIIKIGGTLYGQFYNSYVYS